jgi:hypothetical protein
MQRQFESLIRQVRVHAHEAAGFVRALHVA